ncbi:adenine-specific DNA-methyltransferase [Micrococcus luteus]|uniref:Adenine-specific DNA-methyltransferase n=1 Tax=Micrococcus luteus TaxID=1270 RepID=A0ABD7MAK6_MICLU|nr:DNA methyltransferase [Micrococcus luteus]SHL77819.1 adenine-specific DNA-methyltransferase [Micrococcus luteus]
MSSLSDLLGQVRATNPDLAANLEREIKNRTRRQRQFGLVFEEHRPEAVELPSREVRKGDKVRVLPPRGETKKGDQTLWRVQRINRADGTADLVAVDGDQETQAPIADLVVVAEFRDHMYPGLIETGRVERGGDKPFHTVINAENFHALEMLTYTHRHKVDCIYIDPPYNTGAKDWKYNNDYVEADDDYRHSKWLSFMERRLQVARELLNPEDSVLIVTIDEKEYLRLGMLLQQTFPEGRMQMVTAVINPAGTSRDGLARVDEYIFFVFLGSASPGRVPDNLLFDAHESPKLAWLTMIRGGSAWTRTARPNLCYPIHVHRDSGAIVGVGTPFGGDDESTRETARDDIDLAWPVRSDGRLGIWRVNGEKLLALAKEGFAYASKYDAKRRTWSIHYLQSGTVDAIQEGRIKVRRQTPQGPVEMLHGSDAGHTPKTVWHRPGHNAGRHGSEMIRRLIPGRRFPFPKALYAVEDAIRIATSEKPSAVVLDFFSGSGTTAHAVMRLNKQDGGRRQCISVTNNEVGADEQKGLRKQGLRPGDPEWEQWGICDYITKPRVTAAITGKTPAGDPIKGDYKFTDEFPMSDGLEENAAFFTLTYESPLMVRQDLAFKRIAPLLWMRAGSRGRVITEVPATGWDVAEAYGVLTKVDRAAPFAEAVAQSGVGTVYVVTDDERRYQAVCALLPEDVTPVRLYESYLTNFEINTGGRTGA